MIGTAGVAPGTCCGLLELEELDEYWLDSLVEEPLPVEVELSDSEEESLLIDDSEEELDELLDSLDEELSELDSELSDDADDELSELLEEDE